MKKILETIKNIFSIEDLRKRIINTFLYLLMFRIGSSYIHYWIDLSLLADSQGGMLGLINTFAGGAFGRASILALGIMPYLGIYRYPTFNYRCTSVSAYGQRRRRR